MPLEELKADLSRLRSEIESLDSGDSEALQRLEQLAARIEQELEDENAVTDPAGLVGELEDAVSRFEASHPTLGALLNNLIVLLGGMGV